jgi:hypothetical protein
MDKWDKLQTLWTVMYRTALRKMLVKLVENMVERQDLDRDQRRTGSAELNC